MRRTHLVVQRRILGDLLHFQGVLHRCWQKDRQHLLQHLPMSWFFPGAGALPFFYALQRRQNENQGQGSHHEIEDDQQRRRGLHRACGSVHLLRWGVERAVKTCHFSRSGGWWPDEVGGGSRLGARSVLRAGRLNAWASAAPRRAAHPTGQLIHVGWAGPPPTRR
jgi:hypothetical protein